MKAKHVSNDEAQAYFESLTPTPEQRALAKQVQARIRERVSPWRSLSQELITERRAESANE